MRLRHAPVLLLAVAALCAALFASAASAAESTGTALPGALSLDTSATGPESSAATASASATATGPVSIMSAENSVTLAGQSIVAITAAAERTGSGVCIAPNRVLTSTRVLKKNDGTVMVMTVDGSLHSFRVLGRDEGLGLVLLDVELPSTVKPIAGWSPARPLVADSPVTALGLATGAREVLRLPGVVDAPAAATGQDLIPTDIKLDPLVEGGALVTPDGKLAGILTAKSKSPELGELGWSVTSEAAKAFVGSLEEKQQAQAAEDIRKVIRRWVVWGILLLIAGLFGLFGWWFRRWYKRMEARELAEEAARAGVTGEDGPITDRAPPVVTPAEDAAEDLGE